MFLMYPAQTHFHTNKRTFSTTTVKDIAQTTITKKRHGEVSNY